VSRAAGRRQPALASGVLALSVPLPPRAIPRERVLPRKFPPGLRERGYHFELEPLVTLTRGVGPDAVGQDLERELRRAAAGVAAMIPQKPGTLVCLTALTVPAIAAMMWVKAVEKQGVGGREK
jgi:hypothetical protein